MGMFTHTFLNFSKQLISLPKSLPSSQKFLRPGFESTLIDIVFVPTKTAALHTSLRDSPPTLNTSSTGHVKKVFCRLLCV